MPYADEVLADAPNLWLRMNESSGNPQDTSGNGNHVTGGTGVTLGTPGAMPEEADTSALFDGTDDYYTVPDSATLDVGDIFSVEIWLKRESTAAAGVLIDKSTNGYYVNIQADGSLVIVQRAVAIISTSTVKVLDTKWHHFVWTKNAATNVMYLDSKDVTGTVSNLTITNTAAVLTIGRLDTGGTHFNGRMAHLALYPTALSATRVEAHFLTGRPRELRYSYVGYPK